MRAMDGRPVGEAAAEASKLPVTNQAGKVRPRGQPPKGMKWDGATGCYVIRGRGYSKRKAPTDSPDAENNSPQRIGGSAVVEILLSARDFCACLSIEFVVCMLWAIYL